MNLTSEIRKAFNKAAKGYDNYAKIQNEIGLRLIERLDYLKIAPKRILDLGCGSGYFLQLLKKRYPDAVVFGVDIADLMLNVAKKKGAPHLITADIQFLPFADNCFDLIFANQVLHWSQSLSQSINELARIMNVNACLMFSTLGPDTFFELRTAWQSVDSYAHVNSFMDMHNIGDMLMQEYLLDPVMDTEFIYAHFKSIEALLQSLKMQGVRNINDKRRPSLLGKTAFQNFKNAMKNFISPENKFPLTYEVIYGHAWKGKQRKALTGTEAFFAVEDITRI